MSWDSSLHEPRLYQEWENKLAIFSEYLRWFKKSFDYGSDIFHGETSWDIQLKFTTKSCIPPAATEVNDFWKSF